MRKVTLEDNAGLAFCIQLKHVGIVYMSDPWRDADVWPCFESHQEKPRCNNNTT